VAAGIAVGLSSGSAAAAESEAAHVRVAAALLEEIVQGALPATITLPRELGEGGDKTFQMTGLRYCGAGEKGNGRFRAAGRLGVGEPRREPAFAADEVCRPGLAELAEHAQPAFAEGTVLVDLEATWKPWELKLSAVRAVVTIENGRPRPLSGLDKRMELLSVSSADLRIDIPAGAPIVLHAMPTFLESAVEVAIVLADKAPAKPPRAAAGAREALLAGQANLGAAIPAAFANQVLRLLTGSQPLTIPVDRDEVDIQNVVLTGEGTGDAARLTLTGNATPRSVRETMRWTLAAGGEPLRMSSVRVTAQFEDCAGLGTMAALGCNVRNGARAAAAEGFGQALTQRYEGQLVHELVSPLSLRFGIAGQRIELRGDLVRTAFSARGLSAAAHLNSYSPRSR
jgi:hypothetical protein